MTVQTEAKINEMLSNTQTLVERTNDALSVIDKANAKALADINKASSSFVKTFSSNIEKTVGVGGDFSTLESAISWANEHFSKGNGINIPNIKLVLLDNLVLNRTYYFNGNFTNDSLNITSNGAEITCDFANFTGTTEMSMFNLRSGGVCIYNTKFKCINNTKDKVRNLFSVGDGSFLRCWDIVVDGGDVMHRFAIAFRNSFIHVRNFNASNFFGEICLLMGNSHADLYSNIVSGAYQFIKLAGSSAYLYNASIGITKLTRLIELTYGSKATLLGTLDLKETPTANIAENTLTPNGIIFK